MHKFAKLQEQLSSKSDRAVRVIPWNDGAPGDKIDIQVGGHSQGEVGSFQVLVEAPKSEGGWIRLENHILRMIAACAWYN